uniref:Uncharacterized protein n=1 Tax=Trichobilharzia regenti TaxID=157069 RepID=A0AA85IUR2_TRIRE|nr:unnamed protein product [Trichobilharzia regenti]
MVTLHSARVILASGDCVARCQEEVSVWRRRSSAMCEIVLWVCLWCVGFSVCFPFQLCPCDPGSRNGIQVNVYWS